MSQQESKCKHVSGTTEQECGCLCCDWCGVTVEPAEGCELAEKDLQYRDEGE